MPSQRELVKGLFSAALDLKPEERAAFLDSACGSDLQLRQELEALLATYPDLGSFLEHPPLAHLDSGVFQAATPETIIGPYHLVELIGEGGMGQVWLADQMQPVRRRVALKLIKAGMNTREVVARFESERQAFALMDHPAIAKVFDAGSTPEGRPYFVMEYVAGIPITAYCDEHKLTIRQRMELFIQVCEGVQHAHQKAIIHRDLKPSNILVGEIDGKPMPRIIDFGVAKALSEKLSENTVLTQVGAIIGTLAYMSPEQANSAGEDIDTRSDVYALGVILYQLLVGALPLDLGRSGFDEILRRLREQEPLPPSAKARSLSADAERIAQNRGVDPLTLIRQLRGDPDAIVLKTLEKDRARRYASVSGLSADIGRYLRNEPVIAHPPSTAYRVSKYIRRHRLAVAVASAAALLLIGVAVAQSIELRRITEERDRARRERDRADRIAQFMTGMFKMPDPSEARGNNVTAREILDKASGEIEQGLSKDAEVRADLMYTMADTYEGLGLYPRAQALFEHAADIQRKLLGPKDPKYLRSKEALARCLLLRGDLTDSDKSLREVLAVQTSVLGPQHPDTLHTMSSLAGVEFYEGHYAEAEKAYRELFQINRRVSGPEAYETLRAMDDLGAVLQTERRYQEAENLQRQTLAIYLRDRKLADPDTLGAMNNLAITLEDERHFDEAEKLYRQALETERKVLGPEHADTLRSMNNLGNTLQLEERYPEAEQLEREVLDLRRESLGPEHPQTLTAANNLANTLQMEGRFAEAERLARETLETQRRVLGMQHPDTGDTMIGLALTLTREGHFAQAEDLYRQAVKASLDFGESNVSDIWYEYAHGAMVAGHRDEALEHLSHAIEKGFADVDNLTSEKDFNPLHGDPRFEALVAKARQNAAQPH